MVQRLTLRRRHAYSTRSNVRTTVCTPGGRNVYQYRGKLATIPRCGDCKEKLRGITPARPFEWSHMSRRHKRVTRTYGGSRCHKCVRERIIRAFLAEEQKIVARVMKVKQAEEKRETKAAAPPPTRKARS